MEEPVQADEVQPRPHVHARFRLDSVTRSQGWFKEPGATEARMVEAAHVLLNGVQGEPFGPYTPSARQEMVIVNPAAAKVFFDAPIRQRRKVRRRDMAVAVLDEVEELDQMVAAAGAGTKEFFDLLRRPRIDLAA